MSAKIKLGDSVIVIAGKWKGLKGQVLSVQRSNDKSARVVVEGITKTVHVKPNPSINRKGGIEKKPASIDISNVSLYDDSSEARVKVAIEKINGKNQRINKRTKVALEQPDVQKEA